MKNFGKKYSECSAKQKAQCDKAHGPVKKAPMDALAALAGGGGEKPPMGGDMGAMGDDLWVAVVHPDQCDRAVVIVCRRLLKSIS